MPPALLADSMQDVVGGAKVGRNQGLKGFTSRPRGALLRIACRATQQGGKQEDMQKRVSLVDLGCPKNTVDVRHCF